MTKVRKIYWDSTCFICFLNKSENDRRLICQDILLHAERKEIELWTSTFTIAEVIRPRRAQVIRPLPPWANEAIKAIPASEGHIREIWDFYQRNTAPYGKLTAHQISEIAAMFESPWLQPIIVDERTAKKAVEIARDYDLRPGDSIHAACAVLKKVDVIQHWDRDYEKVGPLVPSESPYRLSAQQPLIEDYLKLGPHPDDFLPGPTPIK